jgi:hypothetical protein
MTYITIISGLENLFVEMEMVRDSQFTPRRPIQTARDFGGGGCRVLVNLRVLLLHTNKATNWGCVLNIQSK